MNATIVAGGQSFSPGEALHFSHNPSIKDNAASKFPVRIIRSWVN
jgi:hypothetical protein